MTVIEAIAKADKALDDATEHAGSDVERARELISAASTWLRMAEILNYCGPTKTDQQ
ncbi:MAG TPA: hypothetical protein VFC19_49390 [Candidatus Limnocylindrales bacterium]|nr:hypothetical protein [Candidatus Limnocylindrales bacterium]